MDASGTVTDNYVLDTFGRYVSGSGSTVNPYKYGAAWGYITDPSGMLQLGHRFYWPEIGRFVQQDPIGDGMNWYGYGGNNPVVRADPRGLFLLWIIPAPPEQTLEEACKRQLANDLAACHTTYLLEMAAAFSQLWGDVVDPKKQYDVPNPTPPGHGFPSTLDPFIEAGKRYDACKKRGHDRYKKCMEGKEKCPYYLPIDLPGRPNLMA